MTTPASRSASGLPPTPRPPADAPQGAELLELERRSRQLGSGISADQLVGEWRLDQLWSKRETSPQEGAAALLRGLQACLAIELRDAHGGASGDTPNGLQLRNSVQLGPVQLRFLGPGELRGRRPLLVFRFSLWQLVWGERVLASGQLAEPAPRRQPFFALIACSAAANESGTAWLAARGRGGGLALWRRQRRSEAPS
jgi:hypothetical protein